MDNNYIQLCAEMAYNDSLMESYFEEENLLEADNKAGFKEKIKKFFEGVKNFIKNLFGKIIQFFKDSIAKLQAKFAKNESASLYNNLMEMVLNEAHDLGVVAVSLYEENSDILNKALEEVRRVDGIYHEFIQGRFTTLINDKGEPKFNLDDSKEKFDTLFTSIEEDYFDKIDGIEKNFDDIMETHKDQMTFEKKADDHLIRYFHRTLDIQNQNLQFEINSIEKNEKYYNDKVLEAKDEYLRDSYSLDSYFYSRKLKVLSKIEKGYATLLKLIIQLANKSKIKDLKTTEPDGSTSYRI